VTKTKVDEVHVLSSVSIMAQESQPGSKIFRASKRVVDVSRVSKIVMLLDEIASGAG
jgi:hypothetical protein